MNWVVLCQLAMVPGGWIIVHLLSVRRERRSEWRKLAHSAVADVEKIEELALGYHKAENRNIEMEEEILKRMERLESKMVLLSRTLKSFDQNSMKKFRRAITMKNFQSNEFKRQETTSQILKNILARTTLIIEQLYTAH